MTWQEELRKLDEELAAGNLTADEYRARRDRVLSMAVSTGDQSQAQPAQPQAPSTAADTQIISPVSPPAQPDQQASSAEATQVVSAADAGGAERTQVVPQWQQQQQQHPNSPSGGFPQPMQQQPPYAQHSPAGGFAQPMQQQPQHPWGAQQQDASPPWGGSEFPPLAPPSNNADWISQGPESFQTQPSSGKGKKIAFAVVAVLVVAGLGFGVWALFIKDGGTGSTPPVAQSSSPQPPPAPTVKPLPEPPAPKPEPSDNSSALVTPAGTTRAGGGEFDIDKLQSAKYLPTTVIEKAKSGGMTEGLLKTTKDGDVTLGLFALEMPNAQAAAAVAAEYGNAEQEGGLTVNRNLSLHGVPVYSAADSNQQVYRAVYVLYNRVVIIDSFGPSKDATLSSFKTLLTAQVQKAPPTERTNN